MSDSSVAIAERPGSPFRRDLRRESVERGRATRRLTSAYVLGFSSTLVVFLPLLGQTFSSYAGVHPRVVGLFLSGLVVLVALRNPSGSTSRAWGLRLFRVCLTLLLVSVFLSFDWSGRVLAFDSRYMDTLYPAYKMTRVFVVLLPMSIVAMVVAPFASKPDFLRGLSAASVVAGILALGQFVTHIDHFTASHRSPGSLSDVRFSVISVSLIILNLQAVCQDWLTRRPSWLRVLGYSLAFLGCLACYYLLSQRTAVAINGLFWGLLLYRIAPGPISGGILGALGTYGAVSIVYSLVFGHSGGTELLAEYSRAFGRVQRMFDINDGSYVNRLEMVRYSMEHGFDRFLTGHGLGSFLQYYNAHYPHNIIAEAFFEQGVVGLVTTSSLLLIAFWVGWRLLIGRQSDAVLLGMVASWAYALKANTLVEFGMVAFWLAVGIGLVTARKPAVSRAPGHG